MARIDYLDDPAAPAATTIVPSANVVVTNDAGEILLIRRSDNENWALPGGAMDPDVLIFGGLVAVTRSAAVLPAYRLRRLVIGRDEGLARLRVPVAAGVPYQSAATRRASEHR